MKRRLTVEALGELDPKIRASVNLHIKRIVDDLTDRSSLLKPREVVIRMIATPTEGEDTLADVEFEIKSRIPPTTTRKYSMEPRGNGDLLFNDLSPDNAKQGTMDELPAAEEA